MPPKRRNVIKRAVRTKNKRRKETQKDKRGNRTTGFTKTRAVKGRLNPREATKKEKIQREKDKLLRKKEKELRKKSGIVKKKQRPSKLSYKIAN